MTMLVVCEVLCPVHDAPCDQGVHDGNHVHCSSSEDGQVVVCKWGAKPKAKTKARKRE